MIVNNKEIYLISTPILKAKSYVNKNVEDGMILPSIKTAQDVYLRDVIGDKLLTKLCQLVEAKAVPTAYEKILKNYVQDYLCYRTMSELQVPLWTKIRAQGIVNTQGTNYNPVSKSDLDYNRNYYANLADEVAMRLVGFLDENSKDYPEWTSTAIRESNKYTNNICLR